MNRLHRFAAVAAVAALLVLALSVYLHSWGGPVLIAVAAAAFAWYRIQVARGEAAERFFGDAGEDTRLTSFQGGSPSEMPPPEPSGLPHGSARERTNGRSGLSGGVGRRRDDSDTPRNSA